MQSNTLNMPDFLNDNSTIPNSLPEEDGQWITIQTHDANCKPLETIILPQEEVEKWVSQFKTYITNRQTTEYYYIAAIINLIKKNNFLNLSLELADELITDEEFEAEIENFPEKYVVNIGCMECNEDIYNIIYIVKQLGHIVKGFTVDEVAEIFGVDHSDLENSVSGSELI